jgi:hypothetical protein
MPQVPSRVPGEKILKPKSIRPPTKARDLQRAVESLESWFRTWLIDVNPEKSNAILFTKRHFRPGGEIAMFNRVIPWTPVVKYLGVKFDNHLTFIPQVEHANSRNSQLHREANLPFITDFLIL